MSLPTNFPNVLIFKENATQFKFFQLSKYLCKQNEEILCFITRSVHVFKTLRSI